MSELTPCCGQFETCTKACTPRGAYLGAKGLPLHPVEVTHGTDCAASGAVPFHKSLLDAPSIAQKQIKGTQQTVISMQATGYDSLADVLLRAFQQAASGKGSERHASGEPFDQQPICSINRLHGSIDGALFQVAKKGHEARRLPRDAAVRELLGAINYLAACVILVEEGILETKTTTD